ncbi:hypothetical protein CXG81DRAFT_12776 [Caulochytrium protostelioides]|uniref:Ubiquitin-like modifier-activating enzyme ATG7 n=1 Tax=Caulochytrium protostelioides TaxID=1555241 RepID=A0A4P9X6K8_9FUNG|nr:hypothetical protein CXG81DRAFT_12776 [Caulochytrium protostelioides]|eukprot:RKP00815.1 hypothetical protein CXG81DRAFT_12776 [Caulochytrium protostelioides]
MLQFEAWASAPDATFWHALGRQKLDVVGLSEPVVALRAQYTVMRHHASTAPPFLNLDAASILTSSAPASASPSAPAPPRPAGPTTATAPGDLLNFNTIEAFQKSNKAEHLAAAAARIWTAIHDGSAARDPSLLNRFVVLTFIQLKRHQYHYWFGFPALLFPTPATLVRTATLVALVPDGDARRQLHDGIAALAPPQRAGFWVVRDTRSGAVVAVCPLEARPAPHADQALMLGLVDPGTRATAPAWALRNLLVWKHVTYPNDPVDVDVLVYRDDAVSIRAAEAASPSTATPPAPKASGWERNAVGKLAPRCADLGKQMDPRQIADAAVDLNLKLMRWRIVPDVHLDRIAAPRVLLLGAGTLGCYVARGLMAWGVRHITLLDSGRVSYSNPVRQPLFTLKDCLEGGRPKAQAAAEALAAIYPGMHAEGVAMAIPMPGHVSPATYDAARADAARLEQLVDRHDVVFLLTDSRESRWLPTLMAKAKGKLAMNVALGFDTFLVVRHGLDDDAAAGEAAPAAASEAPAAPLGCYFCNDVVAPTDSLRDRTLDEQCTVTRPGLAAIASGLAVELMASLLDHPAGPHASAFVPASKPPPAASAAASSPSLVQDEDEDRSLGCVPHQIRGFLRRFQHLVLVGEAYSKCTACSAAVVDAYRARGLDLVMDALQDPLVLETLTGLDAFKHQTLDVEWDEDASDDDRQGADSEAEADAPLV